MLCACTYILSVYPFMLPMLFGAQRTSVDDRRGVGEPLNETTCDCHDCECPVRAGLAIRGTHLVSLQPRSTSARRRRTLEQEANNPPILIFTEPRASMASSSSASLAVDEGQHQVSAESTEDGYSYELPANVHLLTLMETEEGTVMLRLAHIYEAGEGGGALGGAACVDVAALLGRGRVLELREVSLTGAPLEPRVSGRRRWWSGSSAPRRSSSSDAYHQVPTDEPRSCTGGGKSVVALKPMQIRTWEVTLGGDEAANADDDVPLMGHKQTAAGDRHKMDEVDRRFPETA